MHGLDDLALRFAHQEAALLTLLDRVAVLERALAFEVAQREAMEELILQLTSLRKRVDYLEKHRKAGGRHKPAGGRHDLAA